MFAVLIGCLASAGVVYPMLACSLSAAVVALSCFLRPCWRSFFFKSSDDDKEVVAVAVVGPPATTTTGVLIVVEGDG